ncbi:MAG: ribosome small subunit-dependent GTPase A [Dokdonella sp.]
MSPFDSTVADLRRIGWHEPSLPGDLPEGSFVARVIAQHRVGYQIHDGAQTSTAHPAPRFLKASVDPVDRPAVGDFVVVLPGASSVIERILPRSTQLIRAAAGERHRRQVIATNIDSVFVITGLDGDFNPARIERYLLLVAGSGARPVVVLTKSDNLDEESLNDAIEVVRGRVPDDVAVLAINGKSAESVATLLPWLGAGDSAVLVGSSGAGKSTITNTLLGEQRQSTNTVRNNDSRGRHTTTHRALIQLPSGACLIDTPGMREIKLTGEERIDMGQFADIEDLAMQCRFGDCAHMSEPGCAVRAAVENEEMDPDHLESFLKLRDELAIATVSAEATLRRKTEGPRPNTRALGRRAADSDQD